MKRIGVNVRLEVIQKTALLGTAKILRKLLSLVGCSLSSAVVKFFKNEVGERGKG